MTNLKNLMWTYILMPVTTKCKKIIITNKMIETTIKRTVKNNNNDNQDSFFLKGKLYTCGLVTGLVIRRLVY